MNIEYRDGLLFISVELTYRGKMIDEGKINLLYPNEPNHPNQAYIVAK